MSDAQDVAAFPAVFAAFPVRLASHRGGWDVPCPVIHNHRRSDQRWSARLWRKGQQLRFWCGRGCTWREACEATATKTTDWWINQGRTMSGSIPQQKIAATYDYYDFSPTGERRLAYQVVRYDPKAFSQRRPAPDGKGWINLMGEVWAWKDFNERWNAVPYRDRDGNPVPKPGAMSGCVHLLPIRKVPYRLADLRARPDHPVVVVEGEKAADALAALGYVATCSPGGAGKWPMDFGGYLVGRRVVVAADNDEPGLLHAAMVAGSALLYGVSSLRLLRPGNHGFDLQPGADLFDWLDAAANERSLGPLAAGLRRKEVFNLLVRRFPELTWKAGEVQKVEEVDQTTHIKGENKGRKQNYQRARVAATTTPILG